MSNQLEEVQKPPRLVDIQNTKRTIADMAQHGYEQLNKLRADGYPIAVPNSLDVSSRRPFGPRLKVRAVKLPEDAVVINNAEITQTATEFWTGYTMSREEGTPLLKVEKRLVSVRFRPPGMDKPVPPTVAISTYGEAVYRGETNSHGLNTSGRRSQRSHDNPEALQADRERRLKDALAVTLFVAKSLFQVHEIKSDPDKLVELQTAWEQLGAQEMHPGIVVLLPQAA